MPNFSPIKANHCPLRKSRVCQQKHHVLHTQPEPYFHTPHRQDIPSSILLGLLVFAGCYSCLSWDLFCFGRCLQCLGTSCKLWKNASVRVFSGKDIITLSNLAIPHDSSRFLSIVANQTRSSLPAHGVLLAALYWLRNQLWRVGVPYLPCLSTLWLVSSSICRTPTLTSSFPTVIPSTSCRIARKSMATASRTSWSAVA